jgi:predicted nucleotidyltransferase
MKSLEILENRTGSDWTNLRAARLTSDRERAELIEALDAFSNADTSIVVVGSMARQEFTPR